MGLPNRNENVGLSFNSFFSIVTTQKILTQDRDGGKIHLGL